VAHRVADPVSELAADQATNGLPGQAGRAACLAKALGLAQKGCLQQDQALLAAQVARVAVLARRREAEVHVLQPLLVVPQMSALAVELQGNRRGGLRREVPRR
jgi:hypothetical protein